MGKELYFEASGYAGIKIHQRSADAELILSLILQDQVVATLKTTVHFAFSVGDLVKLVNVYKNQKNARPDIQPSA